MTSHSPEPGAEAPGAPSVGGQAGGAGGLAPESGSVIQEQLRQKLHAACMPVVDIIDYLLQDETSHAYIAYAFDVFRYLATGSDDEDYVNDLIADIMDLDKKEVDRRVRTYNELQAESVERVIETCNMKQKLFDFAPSLEKAVETAERRAKRKGHKDVLNILKRLKEVTLEEFLAEWGEVIRKLERRDYEELAIEILQAMDHENRFAEVMEEEIEKLAMEVLNATEEQAGEIIEAIGKC